MSLLAFFTVIMVAAQDDELTIKFLDVFQALFAWPTFNEGMLLTACMWCFRAIERILGTKQLMIFLLYNFLPYIFFYVAVTLIFGFALHFSFWYFVPFGLYIFTLWNIPALDIVPHVSDKMIVTLLMLTVLIVRFPLGFVPITSSILGNFLWSFDLLQLRKFLEAHSPLVTDENEGPLVPGIEDITELAEVENDKVNQIVEMGFTRDQATDALRANDNDVQKAIDSLLKA